MVQDLRFRVSGHTGLRRDRVVNLPAVLIETMHNSTIKSMGKPATNSLATHVGKTYAMSRSPTLNPKP